MRVLSSLLTSSQFQSYLYGIEIKVLQDMQNSSNRFNRTFMELKYQNIAPLLPSVTVSIVPLWN